MVRGKGGDFYAVLGVDAAATDAEIRAAYRRQAWRLHPDRNAEPDAQSRFQRLNEAYATLGDADQRAAYDRSRAAGGANAAGAKLHPISCTECGRATAQPRILAFRTVRSFVVWSSCGVVEGIFCATCARRAGLRASLTCAALGWWAPLGPILTLWAIVSNAAGGKRRALSDQRLLLFNAEAFLANEQTTLAYALARQVQASREASLGARAEQMMLTLRSMGVPATAPRLKDPWRFNLRYMVGHALLALSGPAAALGAVIAFR